MKDLVTVPFESYAASVPAAFDACGAAEVLAEQSRVLVKPNLVNASRPPVTTPVECVREVVRYIRAHSDAQVVVAEGCGDAIKDTDAIFTDLGYDAMAQEENVKLVDLNHAPLVLKEDAGCTLFSQMWLPEMTFTHFIVSVPMLKAHSLAMMTGTLKNMMGFPPPKHYAGVHGSWKKAVFHGRMQQSIRELNRYVVPDLTLLDASVGLATFHLGGPECDPPVRNLLAGFDALRIDREAAALLGMDWRDIGHLRDAV